MFREDMSLEKQVRFIKLSRVTLVCFDQFGFWYIRVFNPFDQHPGSNNQFSCLPYDTSVNSVHYMSINEI